MIGTCILKMYKSIHVGDMLLHVLQVVTYIHYNNILLCLVCRPIHFVNDKAQEGSHRWF